MFTCDSLCKVICKWTIALDDYNKGSVFYKPVLTERVRTHGVIILINLR